MMIPSRRELAREYCVDLNVVQRAVSGLITDKILVAGVGRGTFVSTTVPIVDVADSGHRTIEPPREASSPIVSRMSATVGIVTQLWAYTETVREPDDNWPAAMLHAFEWQMASMPHVTVKYLEASRKGTETSEMAYMSRIKQLLDHGIDGLAVIMPPNSIVDQLEALVERSGLPIVLVHDGSRPSKSIPSVFYDSGYAGFQAAQHLIQRGYENISFYNPFAETWWASHRLEGVMSALRKAGRPLYPVISNAAGDNPDPERVDQRTATKQAAAEFLANRVDSWGIVAANDHAGHGLLDVASDMGLEAGRDFGLIGFDDLSDSRIVNMTSLHPPLDGMGAEAAKVLQSLMTGSTPVSETRLRSHLVSRSSTQSARDIESRQRRGQYVYSDTDRI